MLGLDSVKGLAAHERNTLDLVVTACGATLFARSEEARCYFERGRPQERQVLTVSLGS